MTARAETDTGREFEERAQAIARAIHDPSGTQGSTNFRGREHDAVFQTDQSVIAFEFTQLSTKEKALKDAQKIADLLTHIRSQPENRFKSVIGYVITMREPTADQRQAVSGIAKSTAIQIHCMSLVSLQKSLIDTERYIALRRQAPFGSTTYNVDQAGGHQSASPYVEQHLHDVDGGMTLQLNEIVNDLVDGGRFVLTADFGAGKSEALRQLFERLRKLYFKNPSGARFPLHLNLRDFYGLRTPREVLRRHAEEIGFPGDNSLIAAWRSGTCDLLLDGFDELIPSRWVGGARDLRQIRWNALAPVRQLINETPFECGIAIAGRAQYFSGNSELLQCLGMVGSRQLNILDFTDGQVDQFLETKDTAVPEWLPPRPLLLKFLVQNRLLLDSVRNESVDPSIAWEAMLRAVAAREAERISSLTPDSVLSLIARVSTLARAGQNSLGPVTVDDMRIGFREVCGYEPDEEGLQLLLRLPGLASPDSSTSESRTFLDEALANAAYGEDLAAYIAAPYDSHPLAKAVTWSAAAGALSSGVAASALARVGFDVGVVNSCLQHRMRSTYFDAVLLDVARVGDAFANPSAPISLYFSEVLASRLDLSGEGYLSNSIFADCVIDRLDVIDVSMEGNVPNFQNCLIGSIDGWSSVPERFRPNFDASEVGEFSSPADTTDAIASLSMPISDRIALIILRKVYAQKGSGRKSGALARGIPLSERNQVQSITDALVSAGYLARTSRRNDELVLPVKERRADVLKFLSAPQTFRFSSEV